MSDSAAPHKVTLIAGDGVGPEVASATKDILAAAGANIQWDEAVAGKKAFEAGISSGVPQETIDSIDANRVALKGPLETPVGYGGKSANVTLRKLFEMYGNIRPCRELPNVGGPFAGRNIDLIVVRENVEDVYAGIEHMQSPGVAQCLKLITRKGCEKISRLSFELARSLGRKRVTCATKANIMKKTEGLFKSTFEDVAKEYPEFQSDHIIIDNACHQLVIRPETFDVIVSTNMNGDIVSDLTSGLVGGLGLAPSMNLGDQAVMFEAVHGSAPDIAGQDKVNPTALLLSAVMMLRHFGEFETANKIEHALYVTLEEGKALTGDIAQGRPAVGTKRFTEEVIANLGKRSSKLVEREYTPIKMPKVSADLDFVKVKSRRDVGVDIFIESGEMPDVIGKSLEKIAEGSNLQLKMLSNRGTQVYPTAAAAFDGVDHHRCRFIMRDKSQAMTDADLLDMLQRISQSWRWVHVERLPEFDGEAGYSKAQGED
ncbi:MAG: NADP-dependent isocitrate dehydrogenase [Phycisphaerales bacterium JB065]